MFWSTVIEAVFVALLIAVSLHPLEQEVNDHGYEGCYQFTHDFGLQKPRLW